MLRLRLISSGVILTILLALVWLDLKRLGLGVGGVYLAPVLVLLAIGACAEMLVLLKARGHRPADWAVYTGTLLVVIAACAPLAWELAGEQYPPDCPLGKLGWPLAALAFAVMLPLIAEMQRYRAPGGSIENAALAVFAIAYLGVLMSFLVELRMFHDNDRWGMAALLSVLVIVKMSDIGAYTFGRLLGRHKMTPLLSPKKTVEGGVGQIVTACATSAVYFLWIVPALTGVKTMSGPWWGWLAYGAILAVAAMIGDLAISLLKRDAGRKDSSTWLPGLGGVLDVLDSILTAAAVAYLCWAAGLVGPLAK